MLKQSSTLLSEVRQRKYALFMLLSEPRHRLRLMNCAWGTSSRSMSTELQVSRTLTRAHGEMPSCVQILWMFWQPAVSPELTAKQQDCELFYSYIMSTLRWLQVRCLTFSIKSGAYNSLFWPRTHLRCGHYCFLKNVFRWNRVTSIGIHMMVRRFRHAFTLTNKKLLGLKVTSMLAVLHITTLLTIDNGPFLSTKFC